MYWGTIFIWSDRMTGIALGWWHLKFELIEYFFVFFIANLDSS